MHVALVCLFAVLALTACGRQVHTERPSDPEVDGPGTPIPITEIREPVPVPEPRSPYGNHSPYTVLGQTYHVLPTARGYVERGQASWYGRKFHGRKTSSGEIYDMHEVSAAHRTLPLPSFATVRNLENGREIIVRINDRGPFHNNRVIDLSYAAALKLGVVDNGTAQVEVRAIVFEGEHENQIAIAPPDTLPVMVQAGAFSERGRAEALQLELEQAQLGPVELRPSGRGNERIWRVRIGPLLDVEHARSTFEQLVSLGLNRPIYVYD